MRSVVLLLAIAACSYPPLDGNGATDAAVGGGDAKNNCGAPATYGSPTMTAQDAKYYPPTQQLPEALTYIGKLTTANPADFLDVELVETAGGPFEQGITTATINLTGAETNLATCSGCVLVVAKCTACVLGADFVGTSFLATAGTLQITAVSPQIKGTLTNANFQHVTIDANGNSTPVNDGCATKIAAASFQATVRQ